MIFNFTKEASENFFHNILGITTSECKSKSTKSFYCSKISIYKDEKRYDLLFLLKKDTVLLVSDLLLFENDPDEQTFIDLLKEIANLIGGTAKTLIEGKDELHTYKLSTPEYIGKIDNLNSLNLDKIGSKKIKNRCFVFGIEEL